MVLYSCSIAVLTEDFLTTEKWLTKLIRNLMDRKSMLQGKVKMLQGKVTFWKFNLDAFGNPFSYFLLKPSKVKEIDLGSG